MRNPSSRLAILLALLTLGFSACASGASQGSKDLFLWSISEEANAEPVAWVLGSVHLAREGDGLDRAALDAYDRARTLAVEIDVDAVDPVAINRIVSTSGSYEEGRSLTETLGARDFERLGRLLAGAGVAAQAAERWKPWLAGMVLGLTSLQKGGAKDSGNGGAVVGVDRFFLERARGQRPIVSLETIDEQVDALTSASEAVQLAELRHLIDTLERGESPLDKALDSYMEGDASALEAQLSEGGIEGERKAWLDRILRDRNVHMAERGAALIRDGKRPFIVVGAGHLVGPSAVQTLLGGMGFVVTPIKRTGENVPLVLASAKAGRTATAQAAPGRVIGYRVDWPCAETASARFAAGGAEVPPTSCQSGPVVFLLSTLSLPTGTGGMLSDQQFFGLQMEQFKGLARGPVEHAEVKVGTVDSAGGSLAWQLPASRFAFDTDSARLMGLMIKDGDRVYNLMAVAPLGTPRLEGVLEVLSSLVLVVADE